MNREALEKLSVSELIDEIVNQHHKYMWRAIAALKKMIKDGRDDASEELDKFLDYVKEMTLELEKETKDHFEFEENRLFPFMRIIEHKARKDENIRITLKARLQKALEDHDAVALGIARNLREMAKKFAGSGNGDIIEGIAAKANEISQDMAEHIFKENMILFPKFLNGEYSEIQEDKFESKMENLFIELDSSGVTCPITNYGACSGLYEAKGDELKSRSFLVKLIEADPVLEELIIVWMRENSRKPDMDVSKTENMVVFLGSEVVRNIIFAYLLERVFAEIKGRSFFPRGGFWRHTWGVMEGGAILAQRTGASSFSEALSAGFVHDFGFVIMNEYMPDQLRKMSRELKKEVPNVLRLERNLFGGHTHTATGAWVARLWGVPETICGSIEHHHNYGNGDFLTTEIAISIVADYTSSMYVAPVMPGYMETPSLPEKSMKLLGVTEQQIQNIGESVRQKFGDNKLALYPGKVTAIMEKIAPRNKKTKKYPQNK